MVCQKAEGVEKNFLTDAIEPYIDGDFVTAKGTTLGADNGIAVAIALAILDSDDLCHPPIEVLFTTDEEIGMDGAIAVDLSMLKGKRFLNLDSEEEGILLTSCAGGMSVNGQFHGMTKEQQGTFLEISLSGLQGGHSGTEIHKNRENATLLLSRVLSALVEENICFSFSSILLPP